MRMTRKRRKARARQQRAEQNVKNVLSKSAYLAVAGIIAMQSCDMGQVYAMPQGGQVAAGQAGIHQAGQTMTIAQQTAQAIINWRSFGIMPNEQVNFLQPGANSVMLNRVLGNDPSAIYGKLTANGRVFLVNPNGVFFAPGAQVNVGGLVATTLSITDADFMNGKYRFKNDGAAGSVVNQGTITAQEQGLVALLAPEVKNEGIIAAKKGTVALAAGDQMTLDYAGDGKIQLAVTEGAFKAAAENKGLLEADGGIVLMTARGNQDVTSSVVNQSGIIRARSLDGKIGEVTLDAGQGSVRVAGNVDVSGTNDHRGGSFNAYGKDIALTGTAAIDASGEAGGGIVRIGGDWQGKGGAPHADNVTMEKGAAIHADATKNGDGGKVVLWSDGTTKFAGTITAKGGAMGGDGGMVETSGHILQASGNVNASAAQGKAGEWLLDPESIEISATNKNTPYYSWLDVNTVTNALNSGTGVKVVTTNGNVTGHAGNIMVSDDIIANTNNHASLTLQADASIDVKANIGNSGSGKLDVTLHALANNGTIGGDINIADGKAITTNGGDVLLYGGKTLGGYATSVTVNGTINTARSGETGGKITIYGSADKALTIASGGSLQSGGGDILLQSHAIANNGAVDAGAGNLTLLGDKMTFGGGTVSGTGNVTVETLTAGKTIAVGNGASGADLQLGNVLSSAGFNNIVIGNVKTGAITVNGANFGSDVTLESGQGITVSGALDAGTHKVTLKSGADSSGDGVITADKLDLQGKNASFNFGGANQVNALSGAVKSVTFKNGKGLSVAGLTSQDGAIDLTAAGTLQLEGAVNSGSGDISLKADGITGTSGGLVNGTGKLTIDRATSGTISLGGAGNVGDLHFNDDSFSGAGTLFGNNFAKGVFIGGTNAFSVNVNGALTVNDALTVTSSGAMNFANGGGLQTGNDNLTLNAGTIAFNGNNALGAGTGTLTLQTDGISGWDNIAFDDAQGKGSLIIAPKNNTKDLYIGGSTESDQLAVTAVALGKIKTGNFASVLLGKGAADGTGKGTGVVHLYGFTQPSANLIINGGTGKFYSGTISNGDKETLTLNLDSLEQTEGAIFAIGGNLALNGNGAFNLNSTTNQKINHLTAKDVGGLSVYSQQLGIGSGGVAASGNIAFTTDKITGVAGDVKSTGGDILLKTITGNRDITIGGSQTNDELWLNSEWMKKFLASGTDKKFTIGSSEYTGTITVNGDTKFGSATEFLTKKTADSGNVIFNGNIYAGAAGDKDMWVYTWSWSWTGATVYVKNLYLDIGQGLTGGGKVQSSGGTVSFNTPSDKNIYLTNKSGDVLSDGYQIAYDFLNRMTGFDDFAIESNKNIYMFGGDINQSVNITAKDNVEIKGQVNIGRTDTSVTEVGITGNVITLNAGVGIAVGNNKLTLTTDTLTADNTAGTISGTGSLTVQQRTDGKALSIGRVSAGGLHFTDTQLNGGLFGTGFGSLTLGSQKGGNVTTDMDLTLNNNLTIQAGASSTIGLGGNLTIGGDDKKYDVTLKGGTISNNNGTTNYTIDAGKGTLNLYGNAFDLKGTGTVKGSGILGIGAYTDDGAIYLGDGTPGTGLHLKNDFFSAVFDGFDSYKIGNSGNGQTITVNDANLQKNTILDAKKVSFAGTGDSMTMGDSTTLTLKAKEVEQAAGANLNIANLVLQGSDTSKVTLLNAGNVITGTVSGEGHTIQVAGTELNVGTVTGKGDNTGLIELASDKITFSGGVGSITGAGELYVHQTSGEELYLGSATGSNGLVLDQTDLSSFAAGFKQVSLGNKDGAGLINIDGTLGFNNHTAIYGTTITTSSDTYLTTGGKNLTLIADNLNLSGEIVGNGGNLTLQTLTKDRNLSLGQTEYGSSGSGLFLQSGYFDGSGGVSQVFTGTYGTIYLGRTDGTGTLYQTGSTKFSDNVVILQGSESSTTTGYYASGNIETGNKNFTVESKQATFDNAQVNTGTGYISIKTDKLNINGSTFKGTGGLLLDTYTADEKITIGGSGSGLLLNSDWFGASGAFGGVTGDIQIGSKDTGNIVVNDALNSNSNKLTLTTGGTISGGGSITTGAGEFVAEGKNGVDLTGVITTGKLTATSEAGAVQFTNSGNQISQLGDITAKKNVEIKNAGALTITGTVTGAKDGGKDAVKITLDKGNLTIGQSGTVVSNSGNITLIAGSDKAHEGHFINDSGSDALQLKSDGRWLVYTYDSLDDKFDGLTGDFRKYGAESGIGDGLIPGTGNGSAHYWKPTAKIYAEKTYGDANNAFFENDSFKIIINDADEGTKRMADDKEFLGNKDDFELISGQKKPNSYDYGEYIQNDKDGNRYDGQAMDVNTGSNGTAYGTANIDPTKQISYLEGEGKNLLNYGVEVEFWVKPKKITVTAGNDSVDYGDLGSGGYQGNAGNPNGSLNGTGGNGWIMDGFVNGDTFNTAAGHSGVVNGYTGNSQGALAPGEYNLGLTGDLYADNYVFTYMPGHLTITDVDGSYVPPKPPEPPTPNPDPNPAPNPNPIPRPENGITDAVGTVNSVMKAQPPDDSAVANLPDGSSRTRMMSSLMGDIDPNVPALNIDGMVSIVDVAAAVDFPQGDMDVKAQGRSSSIRLYADRDGFGMLLDGIEGDYSPASSRTDGAIPVLYTDYSSLGTDNEQTLDGFYDVVYTPERLSIEPKAQGETVPRRSEIKPELRQDYAVTYKDAQLGDFRVAFGNGILTVHPQDQKAVDTITNAQKPAQRAVLTAGVLRAIQDFGVTPDQLRAIYLFREKQVMKAQARKG